MVFLQVSQHWWPKEQRLWATLFSISIPISGTSLPFYLFCSLPWTQEEESSPQQTRPDWALVLLESSAQGYFNFPIFMCNLGCTGTPGLCRDAQKMIMDVRKRKELFPKGQQSFTEEQERKWIAKTKLRNQGVRRWCCILHLCGNLPVLIPFLCWIG